MDGEKSHIRRWQGRRPSSFEDNNGASEWRERVSERASEAAEVVSLDSPPWPASAFLLGLDRTKWREREKGSY